MRVGIMQPYLLPYIGYFQLIEYCDAFVIYDDIEYTKRGWINRNRILASGAPSTFTVPLAKAPDATLVRERTIADAFNPRKLLAQFAGAYRGSPYWSEHEEWLRAVIEDAERNLFGYIRNALHATLALISIETEVIVSSDLRIEDGARGQDKVLAICKATGADEYVNPIGGTQLYESAAFAAAGVHLSFLQSRLSPYPQPVEVFVPALSIVDMLMELSVDGVRSRISNDFVIVEAAD